MGLQSVAAGAGLSVVALTCHFVQAVSRDLLRPSKERRATPGEDHGMVERPSHTLELRSRALVDPRRPRRRAAFRIGRGFECARVRRLMSTSIR